MAGRELDLHILRSSKSAPQAITDGQTHEHSTISSPTRVGGRGSQERSGTCALNDQPWPGRAPREAMCRTPAVDLQRALVMERALGVLSDSRRVAPRIHERSIVPGQYPGAAQPLAIGRQEGSKDRRKVLTRGYRRVPRAARRSGDLLPLQPSCMSRCSTCLPRTSTCDERQGPIMEGRRLVAP